MSERSGFRLEVSKGFVAKILTALIGFAGSVVFARVLGPAGYGAFHVVVAVASVLDNPVTGFASACKKRISEQDRDPDAILSAGVGVAALAAVVLFAAAVLLRPYLDYFELERGPLFVAIVFAGVVFFKVLQEMVAGVGHFGTAVILDMLRSLLTIPLQLLFVVSFGLGVAGMVYGLTLGSVLMLPPTLYVLGVRPSVPDGETLRSLWEFARFSVPEGFVGTAYSRLDILLLSAVLGTAAAGQYQIALQLVLPGLLLSSVMASGLFVEVSSQVSRDEDVDTQITNNVAFASLFAIPIFFGALAMSESIVVTVFGDQYRDAGPLLVGLAVYQILQTQSNQISSVLSGHDRPDLNLWIRTATLVANLVVGIALVFWIGTVGVVIATVIAEGVKFTLVTYYARQYTNYRILPSPLRAQFYAGGTMFLVVAVAHGIVGVRSWIELAALVGLGVVVYGVALTFISDAVMVTARSLLDDVQEQYL